MEYQGKLRRQNYLKLDAGRVGSRLDSKMKEYNIPKLFLILSVIVGFTLSFAMPLFNESDGQYHFVDSTNIVGLTNDITYYGESKAIWTGTTNVKDAIQSHDYFNRYFVQTIHKTEIQNLPRLNKIPPILSYDYLGHLIPAVGVWLGYHIYPSMGVMIIVARLFQSLVVILFTFWILKRLKAGQLLIAVISLSPTMINQMVSLSYDTTSWLFALGIIAYSINSLVKSKISPRMIIEMIIISLFSFYFLKTNLKLFLILFPLVIIGIIFSNRKKEKLTQWKIATSRVLIIVAIISFLLVGVIVGEKITGKYGGLLSAIGRLTLNFTYFWGDGPTLSRNIIQVFAAPRGISNHVPMYATALWFVLVALVLISEKKFIKSRFIVGSSLVLFLLTIVAPYYGFFGANYDSTLRGRVLGEIAEVQGRYFTPSAALLLFSLGYEKLNLKLNQGKLLFYFTIATVILTNFLLAFGTWYSIINT